MWRKWRLVDGKELYNIEDDRGQGVNVIDNHPEVSEKLKTHYDSWWKKIEPHLTMEPFRVSTDFETMLTSYDWWYGPRVHNWWHLRLGDTSTGRYELLVDMPGEYRVTLRRWPRGSGAGICEEVPRFIPFDSFRAFDTYPPGKSFNVTQARVRFGDQQKIIPVSEEDQEVTFTFQLREGKTDLQTWFQTAAGAEFGAYYVYIVGAR